MGLAPVTGVRVLRVVEIAVDVDDGDIGERLHDVAEEKAAEQIALARLQPHDPVDDAQESVHVGQQSVALGVDEPLEQEQRVEQMGVEVLGLDDLVALADRLEDALREEGKEGLEGLRAVDVVEGFAEDGDQWARDLSGTI